jgi:hypothetical protein
MRHFLWVEYDNSTLSFALTLVILHPHYLVFNFTYTHFVLQCIVPVGVRWRTVSVPYTPSSSRSGRSVRSTACVRNDRVASACAVGQMGIVCSWV